MTRDEAISEFARLILKYGWQWRADVPREAYDKMREISGILSIEDKLEIMRQGTQP